MEEYDGEKCEWLEPIPEHYEYTGDDPSLKGMKFEVSPDSKPFIGYMSLSGRRSPFCTMVGGCYVCNAPCTMRPVKRAE